MALITIVVLSCALLIALRRLLPPALRHLIGMREFVAASLLPMIASVSPFYSLFAVGAFGVIVFAPTLTSGIGSAGPAQVMEQRYRLLFFCVPLLPMLQFTAMIGPVTVVQLTYFIIICAGVAATMLADSGPVPARRLAGWDATFVLMMAAQLFMDARDNDLMFFLRSVVQVIAALGVPYFVFSRALARTRDPVALLTSLLFAVCIVAMLAVYESTRHWLLYEPMIAHVGADPETMSGYAKMRGGMLRARATFPESTGLSLFLAVALTILFALRRQIRAKWLLLAMAVVLSAGLFVTFARVGYLVVAIGLCMCLVHERRFGALVGLLALLPLSALVLVALGEANPMVAASIGVGEDSAGSIDYRSMLIDAGLAVVADHPLAGMSMPDLLARLEPLKQGEGIVDLVNQPLTIAMRGGLIGGTLYFAMMVRALLATFFGRPRMDPAAQACSCACFAAIVALLVGLTTTSFGRNETTYIMLLGIGAGLAARPRVVRARAAPPWRATATGRVRTAPAAWTA